MIQSATKYPEMIYSADDENRILYVNQYIPSELTGKLDDPNGFLYRNTEHIYDTFIWLQNNYVTRHQPKNIRLIPLYEVTDEAYTVYFEEE